MNTEDNDPDTLQLLDEQSEKWVRNWRKAARKKTAPAKGLTIIVPSHEKTHTPIPKPRTRA